jgi:hypothetical protein
MPKPDTILVGGHVHKARTASTVSADAVSLV